MEGKSRRTSTSKQDKYFQILKMMTEKLHTSLSAVSNNIFTLCALLAVQPAHLEAVQRSSTPVTRGSVSHEILDLFQWSTTIEQELVHLITTLSSAQTSVAQPLERSTSPCPSATLPSTAQDHNTEYKRNTISTVTHSKWLDNLDDFGSPTQRSPGSSPRRHTHQPHDPHNSQDPLNSPKRPNCPHSPSSPRSPNPHHSAHQSQPRMRRVESTVPKGIAERLTAKLSFRRKRSITPLDASPINKLDEQQPLSSARISLNDSCSDSYHKTAFTPYVTSDDNCTSTACAFSSNGEATPPSLLTPSSSPSASPLPARAALLCSGTPTAAPSPSPPSSPPSSPPPFPSTSVPQEESKDKSKLSPGGWRWWSKSTSSSADEAAVAAAALNRGSDCRSPRGLKVMVVLRQHQSTASF